MVNKFIFIFLGFIYFLYADLNYKFINFSPNDKLLKKYCIRNDIPYESVIFYIQNSSRDFSKIRKILEKIPPHSNVLIFVGNKLVVNGCKPGFTFNEKKYIDTHESIKDKVLGDIIGESNDDFLKFLGIIKNLLKKEKFSNETPNFNILENYLQPDVFIFYNNLVKPDNNMNYAFVYVDRYKLYKKKKNLFFKYRAYVKGEYLQFPLFKNVTFYSIPLFMKIKNRKLKGRLLLKIGDNKNIINGWIEIYGVLLAPLKGKVKINNNVIYKVDAKVIGDFYYYGNWAKKGDRLKLILKHGKYIGKYFNYGYVLRNNPANYFEYSLIGK
jgi:hypothetical protein